MRRIYQELAPSPASVSIMSDVLKTVVLTLLMGVMVGGDWTLCQSGCKCKWVSGRKNADCERASFHSIPESLSSEIQSLDLSENQLDRMPSEAFKAVGLVNLHKIFLRDCKIKEVHRDTFKGLGILVEIDLSENRIRVLHPGLFKDNIRLRLLSVNKNPIKKIDANLFNNLFHLQNVELTNCILSEIDDYAFHNVTNLLHLKLNGNQLVHLKMTTFTDLIKLKSLVLHDNPWECDCKLREFRNWVIQRNLYSIPTSCAHPESLKNKMWNAIQPEDFACKPRIMWPPNGISISVEANAINLGCKVSGDPVPDVHWLHFSRVISDNAKVKYNPHRYSVKTESQKKSESLERWVNLTISHIGAQDKGLYKCLAKSPGGIDEKNVSLIVYADNDGFIGMGGSPEFWPLVVGLSIGFAILFIATSALCCWLCCKSKPPQTKKTSVNNPPANGDVMHRITNSNEQEKSLLTINPLEKPPRRYGPQTSENDAIEQAELNRKLLEENPAPGNISPPEEEHPSVECLETLAEPSAEKPASEAHPPDLLAFPSRSQNISPASSSASNSHENSSRASLYPAVHSAPNPSSSHYNLGTLPNSRSHSPFTPSSSVALPKQGYVTIPRRPRAPSRSSIQNSSLLDDPLTPTIKVSEPVYDNLGPRTTADGSSVLSLSKSIPDTPRCRNTQSIAYYQNSRRMSPSPLSPERDYKKDHVQKRVCTVDNEIISVRPKVAPKPPPKPRKDRPLFQDEGEDGTEV